jgi:FtsP/CotA-like multicopper oxidase with cupredoxin domain
MVINPNIEILPYTLQNEIKYFELIAEEVTQEILPGLFIKAWGYNGTTPGPCIQVFQGDYVYMRVHNHLPESTGIHWHGLNISNNMGGLSNIQPSPEIKPGHYFDYHFRIKNPPGTHMYHSHVNSSKQLMMGLMGSFIILDKNSTIHSDYCYMLQEFKVEEMPHGEIKRGVFNLDPYNKNCNFYSMNGKCFPFDTPIRITLNESVKIRLVNASQNTYPMHLHGHQFIVAASDGNPISTTNRIKKNTISIAPGETYDITFKAGKPGIWPLHSHIPHHISNNGTKALGGMTTTIHINPLPHP